MPSDIRNRGFADNREGRFATYRVIATAQNEVSAEFPEPSTPTRSFKEQARSIVSSNDSPDIPFNLSINSYRGCEHGCVYCYARPSHSFLDLSPALDFESHIYYKANGAELLAKYLARKRYQCEAITLGANTDPYQPLEKRYELTRSLLEVFLDCRHPVSLITKSNLVERDIDLLAALARENLCRVAVSLPTMDMELKRSLEPRVPSARARLASMKKLSDAGIPVTVLVAPVIPLLTDPEIETILKASAAAGATAARYIMLRLPHEVEPLFRDWIQEHRPGQASHVLSMLQSLGGGKTYNAQFRKRQSGLGPFAEIIKQRFETACRRYGLATGRIKPLCTDKFRPPRDTRAQLGFDF